MKIKEPKLIFTAAGVFLILAAIIIGIFGNLNYPKKDITDLIKDNFVITYQSKGFEVKTVDNGEKYSVYITLSADDDRFRYSLWCGYESTSFLEDFKFGHADIDEQISDYYFTFLADSAVAYTSHYKNDQEESMYQVKIALNDGEKTYEAKTYMQYLKEKSMMAYDPDENMILSGNDYKVQINDNGSYLIQPISSDDLKRNPDSSLVQYMHDYCSQYFTFKNVNMKITSNAAVNRIDVNFIFTNSSNIPIDDADILIYIYNEQGKAIDVTSVYIPPLEPNESKETGITKLYKDEVPSDFKIAYIYLDRKSYPSKVIVFE